MISLNQNGIDLQIDFGGEVFKTKLSLRIFRRFESTIKPIILDLLQYDKVFDEYYTNELFTILKYKKEPSREFITRVSDFIDNWFKEVGDNKKYKLSQKDTGVLTQEQVDTIFHIAYKLKLLAPILYTTILTTTQIKEHLFFILQPLHDQQIDEFIYKFIQLKFSKKASQSFWKWLAANKFQTINFHILNLFYITISVLIVQLQITYNPISFFKTVIEKSIQWIITDVYTQEIRYSEAELKKIKYVKDYSLIHSYIVTSTLQNLEDTVYNNYRIDIKLLAKYDFTATYKFIALPLLTKLFKTSYIYFYNYKNWGVCSLFTSQLLLGLAPSLTLLQDMCQSYQTRDKKPQVRDLSDLQELYDYPSVYQTTFKQQKIFDYVIKELSSYSYTKIAKNTEIKITPTRLINEYVSFYKNLILSDKFDTIIEGIRNSNFSDSLEYPNIFTDYLSKAISV